MLFLFEVQEHNHCIAAPTGTGLGIPENTANPQDQVCLAKEFSQNILLC